VKVSVEIEDTIYERMISAARRKRLNCEADELAEVMIRMGCRTLEGMKEDEDT